MIRVGLVGYGLAGKVFHAPLIRACERMKLTAIQTSREAPGRVDTFQQLLGACDLVVIASPNTSHFPLAKEALEAGKHVVVDKPFTVTVEEADLLIDLAARERRILTVFHNRRWASDHLTLKRVMPRLGSISLVEAHWDRFRPAIKQGWRELGEPGGGIWYDLGAHMVDETLRLLGIPEAVTADILCQRPGAQVPDYFDVTFHYGRTRACLRSSTLITAPRPRIAAYGSEASFVKHGLDPQEEALKSGADPRDEGFGTDRSDGTVTYSDGRTEIVRNERGNYLAFYEGIAASILDGAPVPVDPRDARDGLALISLARLAAEEQRTVPVPRPEPKEAAAGANSPGESSPGA